MKQNYFDDNRGKDNFEYIAFGVSAVGVICCLFIIFLSH